MPDPYDLIPYTEHAYAESHPDHLEVVARLSGFRAEGHQPSLTPRVLELGCGRGGNLLPMASGWPEATFVGVDRSASAIRDARRVAEAAELPNVSFLEADFTLHDVAGPPFDYVVVHGVYSWVPEDARRTLLSRVGSALAPDGVAMVSFNTLPGWYRRLPARHFLRLAAHHALEWDPRRALAWLAEQVSPEQRAYKNDLLEVHGRLGETDPAYLAHEYLAEDNHPVYASSFLAESEGAGLGYVADAFAPDSAFELISESALRHAEKLPLGAALDLYDLLRETAFRRALLARADAPSLRNVRPLETAREERALSLRVASRLRRMGDIFEGPGISTQPVGFVADALRRLAEVAPRSMPAEQLAHQIGADPAMLASELVSLWMTVPGLDFHIREPRFTTEISARPRAEPVARWHATTGGPVTNVWHQEVQLTESIVPTLLARLDGKTTHDELVRTVRGTIAGLVEEEAKNVVQASLSLLARSSLLVG